MKFTIVALLIAGALTTSEASVSSKHNQKKLYTLMQIDEAPADCPPPLEISEGSLEFELGEFSRNFNMENWDKAMKVKAGLEKEGKAVKYAVTTKELYDKSFSFPKVRNYDYAV